MRLILIVLVGIAGCSTVAREFGPDASLRKYEEFKTIAATLEAKVATIKVAEDRLLRLHETYADIPRKEWARDDISQANLWSNEIAGMKASYNGLAADYNSRMAKVNYSYANVGELPKGASVPLPREFKPYMEK